MHSSERSDPSLLAEWLGQRREGAFRILVERYTGLVRATAWRASGDATIAAEVTQLTFIALARKAESLRNCSSLGGWLHRSAVYHARNLTRKVRREQRKHESLREISESSRSPQVAPRCETRGLLDDALAALAAADREVLILRFYRGQEIAEIANTLAINEFAVRKRIERAGERLRKRLIARGFESGNLFSSTLGIALSSGGMPAASPAWIRALSTNSVSSVAPPLTTNLTAVFAMNATFSLPPLFALAIGGAWLLHQRTEVTDLETGNQALAAVIATDSVAVPDSAVPIVARNPFASRPVDWREVASQLSLDLGEYAIFQPGMRLKLELKASLDAMNAGELLGALDEIAGAGLSELDHSLLERELSSRLLALDPGRGLRYFIDRVHDEGFAPISWKLSSTLGTWALNDPAAATAWFDHWIAQGAFESRLSSGNAHVRHRFEHELVLGLLVSAPASAAARLDAFDPESRVQVLSGLGTGEFIRARPETQKPFAAMIRAKLPDQLGILAWPLTELGETGMIHFTEIDRYFERISASPEEMAACATSVATALRFPRASDNFFDLVPTDLDRLRDWAAEIEPGLADQVTIAALKKINDGGRDDFALWADYAAGLYDAGASEQVIQAVIGSYGAANQHEIVRRLALRLPPGASRETILERLDK